MLSQIVVGKPYMLEKCLFFEDLSSFLALPQTTQMRFMVEFGVEETLLPILQI